MNWLRYTPYAVIETQARLFPDRVALVLPDDDADGPIETVTYRELERKIRRSAAALWAVGVRPGTHVGIWAENSEDWVTNWLATSLLGAVTVAVNTRITAREVGDLIERNNVTHLLVGDSLLAEAGPLVEGSEAPPAWALEGDAASDLPVPRLADNEADYVAAEIDPDRTGLIQFTSGSTGFPKGAQLREGAIAAMGACCGSRWLVDPTDRIYGVFSMAHSAGTTYTTLAAFSVGAAMILPSTAWRGGAGVEVADRCGATILPGVDTIIADLLASDHRIETLRAVVGGFDQTAGERISDELEVEPSNTYGLTEMTTNVALGDLRDSRERRIERLGLPQPGLGLQIVDADGERVPAGAEGEIQVDGWAQMRGYYNVAAEEQPFTADGWLRTGDLGRVDERGYLDFLGRIKDIIRSGGENVSAYEIEHFLESHHDVLQAAVVAAPDGRFGEVPCAFLKLRPGASVDAADLKEFCTGDLAVFKVPKVYEFVEEFPLVGVNKISKRELRDRAAELVEGQAHHGRGA